MKQSHRAMQKESRRGPPELRDVDTYKPMNVDNPIMNIPGVGNEIVIVHQDFYNSKYKLMCHTHARTSFMVYLFIPLLQILQMTSIMMILTEMRFYKPDMTLELFSQHFKYL